MSDVKDSSDQPEAKRPKLEKESSPAGAAGQGTAAPTLPQIRNLSEAETRDIFEQLDAVQRDLDDINEKASEEILQVEQKFNKHRRPHYIRRAELASKFPHFWMTALMNHSTFAEIVTEEEEECLKSLKNLELEDSEDIKSGCKIVFTFTPNRFFENTVITKDFHVVDFDATVETTEIKWKIERHAKNGASSSSTPKLTFFSWLEGTTQDHMDILDVIREDIWPNPVYYFSAIEGQAEEPSSESSSSEEEEEAEAEDSDE